MTFQHAGAIAGGARIWVNRLLKPAPLGAVIIIFAGFHIFPREQRLWREDNVVGPPA